MMELQRGFFFPQAVREYSEGFQRQRRTTNENGGVKAAKMETQEVKKERI